MEKKEYKRFETASVVPVIGDSVSCAAACASPARMDAADARAA